MYNNSSYVRRTIINPNEFSVCLKTVKCIWYECALTDIKREWIWHEQGAARSLHRFTRSSTSRSSWQWHLGLSYEETRWNRTDGLIRHSPNHSVSCTGTARTRKWWRDVTIELVCWITLRQTRTNDDPFNRTFDSTWRPAWALRLNDRMANREVTVAQMHNRVPAMHFYATTASIVYSIAGTLL